MIKVTIQTKKGAPSGLPKANAPGKIEIGDAFEFGCIDDNTKLGLEFKVRAIEDEIDVNTIYVNFLRQ